MFRRSIEKFSRGRSFRRKLPAAFGNRPLYVSPDSALCYWRYDWTRSARTLLDAALHYTPGAISIWDVGANLGVFSVAAAHVAGPASTVLSIEPDPYLASLLQKTFTEAPNQDLHFVSLCAAASDKVGFARLLIANRGRASNALEDAGHRSQAGGTRYFQDVPTITLDSLLAEFLPPDLIKLDVEGAEALVLRGAWQILKDVRPVLYLEVGSEQDQLVTSILRGHSYILFNGDTRDGIALDSCSYNTLAIPAERGLSNASKDFYA